MTLDARTALAGLLRHKSKSNTYKFALIRALNDLALEHPLLPHGNVVVPLRHVAERWLVSSWPFVGEPPILQGPRTVKGGTRLERRSVLGAAYRHPAIPALLDTSLTACL